jgi:hypothetical protein
MSSDYTVVFERLKGILEPYAARLVVVRDAPGDYYLDTAHVQVSGKPLFFGAVRTGRQHVSFHLMPVYTSPALLDGMSVELKRRMQGKSCFNFRKPDEQLFGELAGLVERGYERYRADGFVE